MRKYSWIWKSVWRISFVMLLMVVSSSAVRADSLFHMTFGLWGDTAADPRTFHVTSTSGTESMEGFSNFFCTGEGCSSFEFLGDPTLDISLGGDPAFFNGVADVTIPPDIQDFINIGPHIGSMDLSTPFNPIFNGDLFVCSGNAFSTCGFKLDGATLLIRFTGGPGIESVPEPASWVLLLTAGAAGLWRFSRRPKSC